MKKEKQKELSFSSFLKREFKLGSDLVSLPLQTQVDKAESFIAKPKLKRRLGKNNLSWNLSEVLDNNFSEKENKDIDERLEEEWRGVFERIKGELLEIDDALLDTSVGKTKKEKRMHKSLNLLFSGSEYSHLREEDLSAHNWFVKMAVTVAVAVVFALSVGILTPSFADSILASVEKAARFSMTGITKSVVASDKPVALPRIKLTEEEKVDFILANQEKLKNNSLSKISISPKDLGIIEGDGGVAEEEKSLGDYFRDFWGAKKR